MKTTRILSASGAALLSTAFLIALAPAARATTYPDLDYYVTLNVSPLELNPNGPFSLDLQLVQGSGNVTNTVTLSDFQFVGGSPTGTPDYTSGNESGSLASSVVLINTASDNEFAEALSSGVSQISFKVDETPNSEIVDSGTPIPDQFNIAILDNNLNNIPTTDPSGGNTLVSSALGSNATLASVGTYSSLSPDAGVTALAVPEPRSWALGLLAACAMVGMLGMRRRRPSLTGFSMAPQT
jgi:hypothetical protein